ncbi:Serrate RNA effector molecule -like protein [Toxocara canis]|uniref:Serrate RNA effector molecule homolog n=1 Tax=Toxocara canis TaxID=6265 RepID=A0A0B2VZK5_TOXCA|nr:Serrate RNA effector molecule -like protein [Toxocara canis]
MGDSDDEYHRRGGRDKFARERNDYSDRSRQRDYDYDRRGGGYQRNDYANGSAKRSSSSRRDDYGTAATKRPRIDSASDSYEPVIKSTSDEASSPVMMTFKRFLSTQDDSITDEEAIAKYSEYKMEFKRQELRKFFMAHKDEQWFRLKYHPEESGKRKEEQRENVLRRLAIFEEMLADGKIAKLRMDFDCAAEIIRIMDMLVVKLEGGTDDDVAALQNEKIEDESVTELKKITQSEQKEKITEGGESKPKDGVEREAGNDDGAISDSDGERKEEEENVESRTKKKMLLHKTSSIFLRNVAPSITVQEIETVCKRFPGFLRVGLADPLPERKFYRRGWVTFRRDVNIKEICWNLNGVRIRDCDLGAIINRDLARRVRTVNGVTAHKQVAQNDLRQAAKLTALYDKKAGLYQPSEEDQQQTASEYEMDPVGRSRNPLLKNLTDFLIEEASAEEEELLGISNGGSSEEDQKVAFQRDDALIAKLDRIVVYLRIVHSIDFYNHGEYPNEDVMPNRCGMMHVRADAPSGSQWGVDESSKQPLIAVKFINDFMNGFNGRLEAALLNETVLTDADLENLGKRDPEKEVEAFITANCVELAKDKWLCPLSGKKFKGPEFIRKHLVSKHGEKLEEVRQEATFFNNYLADPKRAQNVDVKPTSTTSSAPPKDDRRERDVEPERGSSGRSGGGSYGDRNRSYGGSGSRYSGGGSYGGRGYDRGGRYWDAPAGRRDPREPVTYKDLDAPEDIF